jgi:V/A-type H+-transporting ATPase subunit A
MSDQDSGRVIRVSGPIVLATQMSHAQMYEVVEVSALRLVGEVIRLDGDVATIQVYENTTGLQPGMPVRRTGLPLSVSLGPGLLTSIYDGIQRPLTAILAESGRPYITRGIKLPALDPARRWHFTPRLQPGTAVSGGEVLGTCPETHLIEHRVLVPPETAGELTEVAPEGDYTLSDIIARVRSASGEETELRLAHRWPVRRPRPVHERIYVDEPLITGQRIVDILFPIAKGGTAAVPGGFGTGKTVMQHSLAKWCDANIIVYVGCGERGNEMTQVLTDFPQLTDPRSGRPLMERTVLIANTSNMPVAAREVSIYTGITLAEYYRDQGYHVALMADSTSRWAEALRELSARLEEIPAEEGFPAYLPSRLAEFYERAGLVHTLAGERASVTVTAAVSPPSGDFSEPVTQHTRRFIRCFWALDTELAYSRHYPSINWLTSYSEYAPDIEEWWRGQYPDWADLRRQTMELLQREDHLQQIAKLVGADVLPDQQRLVLFVAELIKNGFLQQSAFDTNDMYCTPGKAMTILRLLLLLFRRGMELIRRGAPLTRLRELPSIQAIVRARLEVPNEAPRQLAEIQDRLNAELDDLERSYS